MQGLCGKGRQHAEMRYSATRLLASVPSRRQHGLFWPFTYRCTVCTPRMNPLEGPCHPAAIYIADAMIPRHGYHQGHPAFHRHVGASSKFLQVAAVLNELQAASVWDRAPCGSVFPAAVQVPIIPTKSKRLGNMQAAPTIASEWDAL